MLQGLRQGVREGTVVPVLSGSALNGLGVLTLLDTIIEMAPNPTEAAAQTGVDGSGESISYVVAPGALPAAFVFKTMSDQYGKYSFVKVMSGTLRPDMQLYNATTGNVEKLGRKMCIRDRSAPAPTAWSSPSAAAWA